MKNGYTFHEIDIARVAFPIVWRKHNDSVMNDTRRSKL